MTALDTIEQLVQPADREAHCEHEVLHMQEPWIRVMPLGQLKHAFAVQVAHSVGQLRHVLFAK